MYLAEWGNRLIDRNPELLLDVYSAIVFVLGTLAGMIFFGR